MSELTNVRIEHFRRELLTGVSALTLLALGMAPLSAAAADADTDRPTVWIELGGQMENIHGQGGPLDLPFIAAYADSPVFHPVSPMQAEHPPKFAIGGEGKVSFEPEGTGWVFTAGVRFGRSNSDKRVHSQTSGLIMVSQLISRASVAEFADTKFQQSEAHSILDFQVGKDVGLGMFGSNGKSVVSLGVRFAQYASKAQSSIHARPDMIATGYIKYNYHAYTALAQTRRSFHGIGPSLSWEAFAPIAGGHDEGSITLDWGVDAALLFGRQKVSEEHSTTAIHRYGKYVNKAVLYQHSGHDTRSRGIISPNIGGFGAVSFNYSNAKLAFGYRGDFFFGAVDGGWDAVHKENLSFHGPYATISVGLGG